MNRRSDVRRGSRYTRALVLAAVLVSIRPMTTWAQTPSGGGPPREGIAVHGYWTIDVRNPDGTLVEHREFENELTQQGQRMLQAFLLRTKSPGRWAILVGAPLTAGANTGPCPGPGRCYIVQPGSTSDARLIQTLTLVSRGQTNTDPYGITLTGQFTAGRNSAIGLVRTLLQYCPAETPFAQCPATLSTNQGVNGVFSTVPQDGPTVETFTQTELSPVNVESGQIVQISVTLSFS